MNDINKIFCNDILNIIYKYEHNLKYTNVMDELEQLVWFWKIRIGCTWGSSNEPKGLCKHMGFVEYLGVENHFLKNKEYYDNKNEDDNWY